MKRLHVHISVDDLADSIRFYSSMFAHQHTVQKEDYAKWLLDDPRVNFAISQRGAPSGLNHLGIQVESDSELEEMQPRLKLLQSDLAKEKNVSCCYAKSNKYWVTDPQGIAWETFHTLAAIPVFGDNQAEPMDKADCATTDDQPQVMPAKACCMSTSTSSNATQKCC